MSTDNYILVTNYSLPANIERAAKTAFVQAGAGTAFIYGSKWLNSLVAEECQTTTARPTIVWSR